MRTKFLLLFVTIAALAAVGSAQSVGLTAKKVTYKRAKPIMEHRKTFTITYPKIKAKTPAISRKIEAILSYEKAFDFKLAEQIGEIQWLSKASYDVNYNANKLLSISLTIMGMGAYPSSSTKYLVVDTAKGTRVVPETVFTRNAELLAKVVKMKEAEVKKTVEDLKRDPETKDDDVSEYFKSNDEYNPLKLDQFSIDEKGVIFHHDYGFPHVVLAFQPPGEFFLTWSELKPFIRPDGLLSAMVR